MKIFNFKNKEKHWVFDLLNWAANIYEQNDETQKIYSELVCQIMFYYLIQKLYPFTPRFLNRKEIETNIKSKNDQNNNFDSLKLASVVNVIQCNFNTEYNY